MSPGPDPNYPRMMFHRVEEPVIVHSEEEEAALGAEWSRKIISLLPEEDRPELHYNQPIDIAAAAKPRRGRPPKPKP